MSKLTRKDAEAITKVFLQDYPVARQHLTFIFRKTAQELSSGGIADILSTAKGIYVSEDIFDGYRLYRGRVYVVLENVRNRADFLATLRHETCGHFGINTFSSIEKSALLHSIIKSRNEPSIEQSWNVVENLYSDRSVDVQAEEVFARVFEHIQNIPYLEFVSVHGPDAFRETCIEYTRPLQWKDLLYIASMVAHGLHDGSRTQQHFPQDHDLIIANRVNNIDSLRNSGGISYIFWRHADTAIRKAGNADDVNWRNVESMVIIESIGTHGQKPADVANQLCEISPGAISIEQQLALRKNISELAPRLQTQYTKKQSPVKNSSLER